ncbi:MAG: LOG family protein [Candidatus Binatia bacterium]
MSDPRESVSIHAALVERLATAHMGHTDPRARRLLEGLVEEAIGLVADGTSVVDLKLVAAAFTEMRRALAVFRPWTAGPRKVTAFGSARTRPDDPHFKLAEDFGRRIAEAGFMVISGGGPGIMGAVVEGAGVENSFGVGIRLPFEQQPYELLLGDPKLIEFKYFFTRKLFFLKEASGVALFPGGFGTHDEGFETLTLVQTGKARMVPIVCVDVPGGDYWHEWDRFVREQLLERNLISEDDLALYRITHDVGEAVEEIVSFYRVFHSMRTIRKTTVMRLNREVDDAVLETLAVEFADILGGRPIRRVESLKEESDEPETLHLPRVALSFNLLGFGRLRMLINRLNELGSSGKAAGG